VASLALVYEALDRDVLRQVGHKIQFNGSTLGTDEKEVAEYLRKDENQEFMLLIKNKLK